MNSKKIVYSTIKTVIAIIIFVVIAMFVYKMCTKAYNFGYRIFAEEAMSPAPGYTISVAIVEGKSVMEIGEILQEKGLIRSAYLFYLQEMVSNYHGQLKPGVYELSTSMTPEEMIQIIATGNETEDASTITESENSTSYIEADENYTGDDTTDVYYDDTDTDTTGSSVSEDGVWE